MSTQHRPIRQGWLRAMLAVLAVCFLLPLPAIASAGESSAITRSLALKKVTVPIEGICSVGLADIRAGLNQVSGISKIEGSLTGEGIEVTYDSQKLAPQRIAKLIRELGYRAGAPTAAR